MAPDANNRKHRRRPRRSRFHPSYWPLWCGIGLLRLAVLLPYAWQLAIGRRFGRLVLRVAARRRAIAAHNLALCFPELDADARARLLTAHFESLGIMVLEVGMCWWGDATRLTKLVQVEGLEHLGRAQAASKGVLLLSAHFTTLEIGGRLLGLTTRFHPLYKPSRNAVLEHLMRTRRNAHFEPLIQMDDARTLLRALGAGMPVWYAPDQGFLGKGSIPAPFFGVPAPTNPATARLARVSGAPVVPFFVERLPDARGYALRLLPALQDFPSDDAAADAARVNALIEAQVRRAPEQYLWAHNRFKSAFAPKP